MDGVTTGAGGYQAARIRRPWLKVPNPRVRPTHGEPTQRKAVTMLPAFIPPQLATLVDRAPAGGECVHDIKFDGYCMAVRLEDRSARMTRNALEWTARFGPIATAAAMLKARTAYLNGEIVVLDDAGISDFGALQEALSEGRAERMKPAYGRAWLAHISPERAADQPRPAS
jgi:bifunctional non-homologous end joining protein LigD